MIRVICPKKQRSAYKPLADFVLHVLECFPGWKAPPIDSISIEKRGRKYIVELLTIAATNGSRQSFPFSFGDQPRFAHMYRDELIKTLMECEKEMRDSAHKHGLEYVIEGPLDE